MKVKIKLLLVFVSLIVATFIIIVSCSKNDENESKKDLQKSYFQGFQPDTTYVYRCLKPNTSGDSTYEIALQYLSGYGITRIDVNVVESEDGDLIKSYIFIDETVTATNDTFYFSWTSESENIWVLKLGDSYMMDVDPNKTGGIGRLNCFCPGIGVCWEYQDYDEISGCWDFWCDPAHYNACDCTCEAELKGLPIGDITGPFIIIQSSSVYYDGVTYD